MDGPNVSPCPGKGHLTADGRKIDSSSRSSSSTLVACALRCPIRLISVAVAKPSSWYVCRSFCLKPDEEGEREISDQSHVVDVCMYVCTRLACCTTGVETTRQHRFGYVLSPLAG